MTPKAQELVVKRKKIMLFFGLIIILTLAFAVKKICFKPVPFDKNLESLSMELNKNCPMMVDQNTRLDGTKASEGKRFEYHYTLVNIEKDNIKEDELQKFLYDQILDNLKNNPDLKYFKDNETIMSHSYKDRNNNPLFDLTFTASDYN
jgi:hypothetical protein